MSIKFIKEYEWLLKMLENDDSDIIEIYLESGRGGGKNAQIIISFFAWMADNNISFNAAVFRKQAKAIKELWNDFCEYAIYEYTVKHKFQEMSINNNKLTFNSLYTSSGQPVGNLGKSMGLGKDYMIIWEDESTDITNEDRNKIEQAYARFGKKMIIIRSWNPWSPYNQIVKYMAEYMPYPGVSYMKQHHFERKHVNINGISSYFFRTSAYINPFASKPHIKALEKQASFDEDEGNTILWAKPGVVDGAIYKDLSKCIVDSTHDYYLKKIVVGVDFGTTDATSAIVVGIGSDSTRDRTDKIHVLDEYFHQNKKGEVRKTLDDYTYEVAEFLVDTYNKYNIGSTETKILDVYVDYAKQASQDTAFVDMLKQYMNENGLYNIAIHKASKKPIRDRIALEKYLMASNNFTIVRDKAPNLLRELLDSYFDTSKIGSDGMHPRVDLNNHAIDAFEYALIALSALLHKPDYLNN